MYEQVEKMKENKSRSVANSVCQKKGNGQGLTMVDKRAGAVGQRVLQSLVNKTRSGQSENFGDVVQLQKTNGLYLASDKGNVRNVNDTNDIIGSYKKGETIRITDGSDSVDSNFNRKRSLGGTFFSKKEEHVKGYPVTATGISKTGWIKESNIGNNIPMNASKQKNENDQKTLEEVYGKENQGIQYNLYNILGVGKSQNYTDARTYKVNGNDEPQGFFGQGKGKQKDGAYFQSNENKKANEKEVQRRMIFNLKDQNVSHYVASELNKEIKNSDMIFGLKFYGSDQKQTDLKYDKMVVYYQATADQLSNATKSVHEKVKDLLNDYKKQNSKAIENFSFGKKMGYKSYLIDEISPFYTQLELGIGDGVEISGTSFTSEREKDLKMFIQANKKEITSGNMSKGDFVKFAGEYIQERIRQDEEKARK